MSPILKASVRVAIAVVLVGLVIGDLDWRHLALLWAVHIGVETLVWR
jgi:hypothetical protein